MPHSFNVVWCYFFKVFAFSFYDVCNACQITVFFNQDININADLLNFELEVSGQGGNLTIHIF